MTEATYSWPKPNLLSNGDFEGGTGPSWTDWTNSGSVAVISGLSANGKSGESVRLGQDAYTYQDRGFVVSSKRGIDQDRDLSLELYAAYATAGSIDGLKVQVFLLDSSSDIQFSYDFEGGSWVAATSTSDMTLGESWGLEVGTDATWTQFKLPKIYAPSEASNDVADDWLVRVRVWNDSSVSAGVGIDDVVLSEYRGNTTLERVGRYAVAYNGIDYPVKYDHRTGTVTELSLNYPYQTDNSALPTVTAQTTGGELTDAYWKGYAYTFYNSELGEESALPLGVNLSSGYFFQQNASSADTNSNDIAFSAIEIPNQEVDKDTDSTEMDRIIIWGTPEHSTQDACEVDLESGWLTYEGDVAVGATFTSTLSNDDLNSRKSYGGFEDNPAKLPAPFMDVSTTFRSRLWFAGSKQHRLGACETVTSSEEVEGIAEAVSGYPTLWGRWAEWMVFQKDGDSQTYDVERYIYTDDDGTSVERVNLTEVYAGTGTSNSGYTLRPRSGRVYFTEEGKPFEYSGTNFFTLDGDEGEPVVALGAVGRTLLALTRNTTYTFDYQSFPGDLGGTATPVSRDIGCIAAKSFIEIRGVGYWLSNHGIVRSNGGSVEVIGNSLQDIFTDQSDPDNVVRSRADQLAEAYAGHYPEEQQMLMAVRTKNATQGCDVVLAYNYFFDTWDIFRVRAGVTGFHESVGDDGQPVLLFTDGFGQVNRWGLGTVDGAGELANRGQLRGKVISATELGAELALANGLFTGANSKDFTSSATLGLDGAFIKVTSATDGTVQYRRVFDNDGTGIRTTKPWDTTPSADDWWELGGIDHLWKLKNSTMSLPGRIKNLKSVHIYHKDEDEGGAVEVRYYPDFATTDAVTALGEPVDTFLTGGRTQSDVRCHETVGYTHRIEFDASGPETPFEVRFLECAFKYRELNE